MRKSVVTPVAMVVPFEYVIYGKSTVIRSGRMYRDELFVSPMV